MSAAHELIERGFRVAVFEKQPELCGGKARSIPVPVGGLSGSCPDVSGEKGYLPGEHGFRFFPRFYKHVTDTMSRIPFGDGHVIDNLVDTTRVQLSLYGKTSIEMPARFPRDEGDFEKILQDLLSDLPAEMGLEEGEIDFFVDRLWQVYSSCDARREEIYETMGWWEFVDADNKSKGYQKFLAEGLTRSLVAANAHLANAHVEGDIGLALILDLITPGPSTDRVLNGPTNEVWLHPWLEYLRASGVEYQFDRHIDRIVCRSHVGRPGGVIEAVHMSDAAGNSFILDDADYYIAALPAEKMALLLDDGILAADTSLEGIKSIGTGYVEWMNGIQFFLKEDVPLAHGHTIYLDSPWALTSVSQQQFWAGYNLADYGDGNVKGVISVDISNWHQPGNTVDKAAKYCTADEIKIEVWEELKRSHSLDEQPLTDDMLYCWFLDPDITREQFVASLLPGFIPDTDVPDERERRAPVRCLPQHLAAPPPGIHPDLELLPRLRLRAHLHLGGDHGGSERGGETCRERDHPALGPSCVAVPALERHRARPCLHLPLGGPLALPAGAPLEGPVPSRPEDHRGGGPGRSSHQGGAPRPHSLLDAIPVSAWCRAS